MALPTRHERAARTDAAAPRSVAGWPRLVQILAALVAVAVGIEAWVTPSTGPAATVVVVAAVAVAAGIGWANADDRS